MKLNYYISSSNNIYENLALEDYILKSITSDQICLLFYTNNPCVVFGKFQNPWQEIDTHFKSSGPIDFARRQSGGGCVYHDLGNLNFSFIYGDREYFKDNNLQIIINALKGLNIEAFATEKSNLCTLDNKKFSGSAFKQKKDTSLHHGTLLIESNLLVLEEILKSRQNITNSKSVKSNPANVINLKEINPSIDHSLLQKEIVKSFEQFYNGQANQLEISSVEVASEINHLQSWDWIWGSTPYFETTLDDIEFTIKKGVVINMKFLKNYNLNFQKLLMGLALERDILRPEQVNYIKSNMPNFYKLLT